MLTFYINLPFKVKQLQNWYYMPYRNHTITIKFFGRNPLPRPGPSPDSYICPRMYCTAALPNYAAPPVPERQVSDSYSMHFVCVSQAYREHSDWNSCQDRITLNIAQSGIIAACRTRPQDVLIHESAGTRQKPYQPRSRSARSRFFLACLYP